MTKGETFAHAQIADKVVEVICMSPKTSNNGYVFPLYIFNFQDDKQKNANQFVQENLFYSTNRIENFAPAFREFIDKKYDYNYSPEEIMGYIYAILYNPNYRRKYAEFLRFNSPRIPFVDDRKIFEKLSALGWELVQAHLLKKIPSTLKVDITKGSDVVEKPSYNSIEQRLYINPKQYFEPVTDDIWNFHIGGYQVLDKYLKYRKGRELTLDELENIINIIKILRFTIDQMEKIDKTFNI